METYDAIVIGGGPSGSTCARWLVGSGARVLVIDRAEFPRVKLCAGWLSVPIWDVLELSPRDYPHGLWEWERCHVHFGGDRHTIGARGYFIRRYQFDQFLLQRSGAELALGHNVRSIEPDGDGFVIDGVYRAQRLIGAGGTHCPVARAVFPPKPERPVGVKELELPADPEKVAATRAGLDGEPELLLHQDLRGYSWNIPKTDWLNVGCGTLQAREVREAWEAARRHFSATLPPEALMALEKAKGHSYYLYDPRNLDGCRSGNAFLVGDALGLAQPLTAEGILPGVLSGRICAESLIDDRPDEYRRRLEAHPVMRDYRLIYRAREGASGLRSGRRENANGRRLGFARPVAERVASWAVARGFAWMFSGRPLPGARVLDTTMRAWDQIRR